MKHYLKAGSNRPGGMNKFVLVLVSVVISATGSDAKVATRKSDRQAETETADMEQYADVYCSKSETVFKNDAQMRPNTWGDESPVFVDIPEQYSGLYITERDGEYDNTIIKFKVKKAGIVILADRPRRANRYLLSDGWKVVGRFAIQNLDGTRQDWLILEKYLEKGRYEIKREEGDKHPLLLRRH